MFLVRSVLWLCFVFFFFFSSRRRHTRSLRDWSSDVCSSDLPDIQTTRAPTHPPRTAARPRCAPRRDCRPARATARRSEERRVGKSVDLGGRRIIKKKKKRKSQTRARSSKTRDR